MATERSGVGGGNGKVGEDGKATDMCYSETGPHPSEPHTPSYLPKGGPFVIERTQPYKGMGTRLFHDLGSCAQKGGPGKGCAHTAPANQYNITSH